MAHQAPKDQMPTANSEDIDFLAMLDDEPLRNAEKGGTPRSSHSPANKRQRTEQGQSSTPQKTKGGTPSEGADTAMVKRSPFGKSGANKEGGSPKMCGGCQRTQECSDWTDHESKVQWARPHGAGFWCASCHACWRTCFSVQTSQNFFMQWLDMGENRQVFEDHLIAYLSLVAESKDKITQVMIQDRVKVFRWYDNFRCLTPGANVVVPLSELFEDGSSYDIRNLSSTQLTTLSTRDGLRLAAHIKRPPQQGDPPLVQRPIDRTQTMPFTDKLHLTTGNSEDMKLLEKFSKDDNVAYPDVASSTSTEIVVRKDASSPTMTKMQRRVNALINGCKELLSQFGTDSWCATQESHFTKHAQQFAYTHTECGQAGETTEVIAKAEKYLEGVGAGKLFVRRFREYGKSKHRVPKLVECTDALEKFIKFLREEGFKVHAGMSKLLFKGSFHKHIKEVGSISEAFAHVLKGTAPMEPDSGLDSWLRGMILYEIAEAIKITKEEDVASSVSNLLTEVVAIIGSLEELEGEELAHECATILEDLRSFSLLLQVVDDDSKVDATQVQAAVKKLSSPSFSLLKQVMVDSDLGKQVTAATALMMQASGRDSAGDARLEAATKLLHDDRLPRATSEDGIRTVKQFEHLVDGKAMGAAEEVIETIQEALSLWSRHRLATRASDVSSLVANVHSVLLEWDRAMCAHLVAVLKHSGFEQQAECADDNTDFGSEEILALIGTTVDNLERFAPDDDAMLQCGKKFVKFLEALPTEVTANLNTKDMITEQSDCTQANGGRRMLLVEAITRMGHVVGEKLNPQAMLSQFLSADANSANNTSSTMEQAVRLGKIITDMKGESFVMGEQQDQWNFELTVSQDGEERTETIETPHADIAACIDLTHDLAEKLKVGGVIGDMLHEAIKAMAETLGLDVVIDASGMSSKDAQGRPISTAQLMNSGTTRDRLVREAEVVYGDDNGEWRAVRLALFLQTILSTMEPEDAVPLGGLVKAEETQTTLKRETFEKLLALWMPVHKAVATAAWLHTKVGPTFETSCVEGTTLQPGVEAAAMAMLEATQTALQTVLSETWDEAVRPVLDMKWSFPINDAKKWLQLFEVATSKMHHGLVHQFVLAMDSVAGEVSKMTPQYDHIISDDKLSMGLAKKHVLGWPTKNQLGEGAVKLYTMLAYCSKIHTAWKLSPEMTVDPTFGTSVQATHDVFTKARCAVAVIAALRVLSDMKGNQQKEEAAILLTKKRNLIPKTLLKLLEKVS